MFRKKKEKDPQMTIRLSALATMYKAMQEENFPFVRAVLLQSIQVLQNANPEASPKYAFNSKGILVEIPEDVVEDMQRLR